MKKSKKISVKEIKRAFVVAQLIRQQKGSKRYLGLLTKNEFEKRLRSAKSKVLKMSDKQLDQIIKREYKKRLHAYNSSEWRLGRVRVGELGVWRGAGGLPRSWTNMTLTQTANKVKKSLRGELPSLNKRAKHSIENILNTNVHTIQREKYLLPIVFRGGTGTKGRGQLTHKTKWDIDDGCMRAIALVIYGATHIRAYIGTPKK